MLMRRSAGRLAVRHSRVKCDVMLTSAFIAYVGYFDQQFHHTLFSSWASHMQQANISFRPDLAIVEVRARKYMYM